MAAVVLMRARKMALVKCIVNVLVWNVGAGIENLVGMMWEVVVWWRE